MFKERSLDKNKIMGKNRRKIKNYWKLLTAWKISFLVFFLPISDCGKEVEDQKNPHNFIGRMEMSGLYPGPYFDVGKNIDNVSAYIGTHAYLYCYVKQLGNKSVSWIRKSDAHILTVDRFTFIADERFQVLPLGDSWTLQVKYVQPRDAGIYECQISTEPKLAFRVKLRVMVPSISMDSKEENMFIWEGSQVQLRCIVENVGGGENFGKLSWFKNGELIEKHDPFTRNILFHTKVEGSTMIEMASFGSVGKSDSGNYTCSLPPIGSATVILHVLNGENPAAMHHGKGLPSISSSSKTVFKLRDSNYLNLLLILIFSCNFSFKSKKFSLVLITISLMLTTTLFNSLVAPR